MWCERCGAQLATGQGKCEYCGAIQHHPTSRQAEAQPGDRQMFERVKQSPAWANRNSPERQARLPEMSALATTAPLFILGVFIAISGVIAVGALLMSGIFGVVGFGMGGALGGGLALIPIFMAIVPIGFVVFGIFAFTKMRRKMTDFKHAPILSHAALITGKRTQVSGGSGDSSATTRYFVTAEFEDGQRNELTAMTPDLYGRVCEGDAGVLFVRDRFALDFDHVRA